MLKRNKAIAIVMAFVFCLTFLAPALISPSVAEAAFTSAVAQSNNVPSANNQNLGYFKVEVSASDWTGAGVVGSQLLVSYPTRLGTTGAVGIGANYAAATGASASGVAVVVPTDASNAFTAADITSAGAANGSFVLNVASVTNPTKDKGWFYVHLYNVDARNYSGDVNVSLIPQAGTVFGTTPSSLVVGKVNVSGSTTTTAKSVTKIPSSGGTIDSITIFENMAATVAEGATLATPKNITLQLVTKGYEWDTATGPAATTGLFSFTGGVNMVFGGLTGAGTDTITLPVTAKLAPASATAGAISLSGLAINVDEKVAKVGQDIEVKVSGAGTTAQTIVVGQYVDFVASVVEDTTTELTAGLDGQTLGTFFVEEVAPGTLIENRTILFELPAGVEWNTASIAGSNYAIENNSAINFSAGSLLDARTLKFDVNSGSQNAQNGAKVKFKSLKVDVSPSFTGDVTLTVSGKAGVEGTAKVATVNPIIKMTANAPQVNLGLKEQKVSDVEIVEQAADTIVATNAGIAQDMAFYLDSGYRFAKVPKVEVVEGDMVLEVKDVKIQAPANGQNLLIVPIRAASYKTPAKIKISDIYVTADRTAPVGDVVLYAADTNSYANGPGLVNAFNSTARTSFQYDNPASVVIAKNVTAPPVENQGGAGSGTFVIGSNIYTVNGITKVMDVAPYIKGDRTYVPYRYLALALGVANDDIVWDQATQKVTITKGDNVVEATIGSTTLTVNGESQVMDVAPEISNDRTMLPARYLAEALGANVGWDPATRTVVFEM